MDKSKSIGDKLFCFFSSIPYFFVAIFMILVTIILVVPFLFFMIVKTLWLSLNFRFRWYPKGKYAVFVYSDSPNWKEYVETNLFPKISDKIVILNWSKHNERNTGLLEVKIFKHWAAMHQKSKNKFGWAEFCPMAITFAPWWFPKDIRFWQAFKDYKNGRKNALEEKERELFEMLKKVPS